MDIDFACPERTALEGIKRLEQFFVSIGLPVTLEGLDIPNRLEEMADKCTDNNRKKIGSFVQLDREDVLNILKIAAK